MLKFNDLKKTIGEDRTIKKATLWLECTNARGTKPVEAVAYPFIERWDLHAFSWSVRLTDKKTAWNESPVHINIEPGDDQSADTKQFDFVRKFERTKIACKGKMEASGETHMQAGALATFDVTAVVRLWYEGKLENNGWALLTPGKGNYIRFYASNGDGMAPRLDVEVE